MMSELTKGQRVGLVLIALSLVVGRFGGEGNAICFLQGFASALGITLVLCGAFAQRRGVPQLKNRKVNSIRALTK